MAVKFQGLQMAGESGMYVRKIHCYLSHYKEIIHKRCLKKYHSCIVTQHIKKNKTN